jgi:hypothetical protein
MFSTGFLETGEMKATLPEDNEDIFELFLEWVYSGRYGILDMTQSTPSAPPTSPFMVRIKLYAFAEKDMHLPADGLYYDGPNVKLHIS